MHRRQLLLALAALAAAPGVALADVQRTPLSKAFNLLDVYLGLPPGERNRFYLAYRATLNKRPDPGAVATIVEANGVRAPLPFDHAGNVLRLPTLAELKSAAVLEADSAFKLGLELRAAIAPATRLDVGALSLAMAQVNAAVAKIAGPLALVAPKLTCAFFPDSGGGSTLMADGRSAPLPVFPAPLIGPVPYFDANAAASARTVVLTHAPSRILLGAHPKP